MLKTFSHSSNILGTVIDIQIVDEDFEENNISILFKKIIQEAKRIENTFSRFKKTSYLSSLNKNIGHWQAVSQEASYIIQQALKINKETEGFFDITITNILQELGYDEEYSFKKKEKGDKGELLYKDGKIKMSSAIDFGGLGKGYFLDRVQTIFKEYDNICISAGGDIFVKGVTEKQLPWKIVFEHPTDSSLAIGEVLSEKLFLASSSANKRKWGKYHHLINPFTKTSADNMLAVYVESDKGIKADAYATGLYVMGYEKAKEILQKIPVHAMIISTSGKIYKTKEFQGVLYN